jgi:hypothetical protein
MKSSRLLPLAGALLVFIAMMPLGCSSDKPVPWAASTQPQNPRAAPAPVAPRRPAPPAAVATTPTPTAPAPVASRPRSLPVSRPATTTTSTGEVVRTVRVFCDSNPTPIWIPNPRYQGQDRRGPDAAGNQPWVRQVDPYSTLLSLGARPVMTLYVGTLNRAPVWCDDQWNPRRMRIGRYGGLALDWAKEGNYSDPPDPRAVRACAMLAMDPMFYGDDSYPGPRPIMIDIEGTKSVNLIGAEPSLENRRASIQHMIKAIRAAKEGSQGRCEVWGYGWFPQAMYYPKDQLPIYEKTRDIERELAKEVSAVCLSLYSSDEVVADPEHWFKGLDYIQGLIDKDFPEFQARKVVLVYPRWELVWPEKAKPQHVAMNGKPVPMEFWKRQIDALVKGGWDIYVWMGMTVVDGAEEHLQYVGRFAK